MRTRMERRSRGLSAGERGLIQAYLAVALAGACVAFVVAIRIGEGAFVLRPFGSYDLWLVLSGALGAAAALHLLRDRFGRAGAAGLGRATIGLILASLLTGILGGTLALPLYGTMFGPFALIVTLTGAPLMAAAWLGAFGAAHLLLSAWHAERESIFAVADDGDPDRR